MFVCMSSCIYVHGTGSRMTDSYLCCAVIIHFGVSCQTNHALHTGFVILPEHCGVSEIRFKASSNSANEMEKNRQS